MRNRPKRYSILLIGLVLLLASSIIACAQPSPSPAPPPQPAPTQPLPTQPTPTPEKPPPEKPPPTEEVIPWPEAKNYVGETKVVEGPVVSANWASGSRGKPTFLNIGKPYPDPDRFTVVIWIDNRDKFIREFPPNPETYFLHKTVRVKGFIDTYKGNPQIVLSEPSKIWIVE